jgi:transcriptional regulator with XRE-family HTH domain
MKDRRAKASSGFADRLAMALKAKGQISTTSRTGVDIQSLADGAAVSYEMARRYIEGSAVPTAERARAIAEWLEVPASWLIFGEGEGPAATPRSTDPELLEKCLLLVMNAASDAARTLKPDQIAKLATVLYEEASEGREPLPETAKRLLRIV